MLILRAVVLILLTGFFIGFGSGQEARAACYETIGCTKSDIYRERDLERMSCQILGEIRNSIYAEHGYCFRKQRYQEMFGNLNCRHVDVAAVPLSRTERANVGAIRDAERIKGCMGN